MKKLLIAVALAAPLLALAACGSSTGDPYLAPVTASPAVTQSQAQPASVVDQVVDWISRCGATMLSQIGSYARDSAAAETSLDVSEQVTVSQAALQEVSSWQACAGSNPDPEMSASLSEAVDNYRTAIIDILADNYDAATVSINEATADLQAVTNRVNELKGQ